MDSAFDTVASAAASVEENSASVAAQTLNDIPQDQSFTGPPAHLPAAPHHSAHHHHHHHFPKDPTLQSWRLLPFLQSSIHSLWTNIIMLGIYGNYFVLFGALFLVLLLWKPKPSGGRTKSGSSGTSPGVPPATTAVFRRFQFTFLLAFVIMFAGDWLQGPTVYALYAYYGFSRGDNGLLFIAGFGSSMFFGPFAGALADKYGRRLICIAYGVIYSATCVTKHFNNFHILLMGRIFGGMATSIVMSGFESWMVAEHRNRGFDEAWLTSTFSLMTINNGLVAIPAGLLAQAAVWAYGGHPVAPFDVAFGFLIFGSVLIMATWTENYGKCHTDVLAGLHDAFLAVIRDRRILVLGLIQSFYEGTMYTFIFMWTPALQDPTQPTIPHGVIFSCFMICCATGGLLFARLNSFMPVESILQMIFVTSTVCMATAVYSTDERVLMPAFCVFEIMIGIFWPSMGTLRSRLVPEEHRTAIMNLFRVPLNFLVCAILVFQGKLPVAVVFLICTMVLSVCIGLQVVLVHALHASRLTSTASLCETVVNIH